MKNLITALSIIIMSNACTKNKCEPVQVIDCFSTQDVTPVCGCDNETYINKGYADCFQVDFTDGACQENIKDLVGKWEFLGFESDGARMGKPTREHIYGDMSIEFTNQTFGNSFQYVGKAVVNVYGGAYHSNTNKFLYFSNPSNTEVAGDFAQMRYEERYLNAFSNSTQISYQINGDYMQINFLELSIDDNINALIYKRKL